MPTNDRGNWMQTYTGNRFFPLNPSPEDFNLLDIAHSLSLQCRYNGHVIKFYSVAEHCVHVSMAVEAEFGRELALWGLLHDASEAYVGDMVRPLKLKMVSFIEVEIRILWSMADAFGLDAPTTVNSETMCPIPQEILAVDTRILVDEKAAIMTSSMHRWDITGMMPVNAPIQCWSPEDAEREFVKRFEDLA